MAKSLSGAFGSWPFRSLTISFPAIWLLGAKFQGTRESGTNVPGNERARERKFQGANWPEFYWPIRSWERIGSGAKTVNHILYDGERLDQSRQLHGIGVVDTIQSNVEVAAYDDRARLCGTRISSTVAWELGEKRS